MGLNDKGDSPHGELQEDCSRYRKQEVQRPERGTGPEATQCRGFVLKEGAEQEMRVQVDGVRPRPVSQGATSPPHPHCTARSFT